MVFAVVCSIHAITNVSLSRDISLLQVGVIIGMAIWATDLLLIKTYPLPCLEAACGLKYLLEGGRAV